MTRKATCPGCDAHTSAIATAFREDEPCPYCGYDPEVEHEIAHAVALEREAAAKHLDGFERKFGSEATMRLNSGPRGRDAIHQLLGARDACRAIAQGIREGKHHEERE